MKLGSSGIEEVIEFDLTPDELAALHQSADAVRELVRVMELSGDKHINSTGGRMTNAQ